MSHFAWEKSPKYKFENASLRAYWMERKRGRKGEKSLCAFFFKKICFTLCLFKLQATRNSKIPPFGPFGCHHAGASRSDFQMLHCACVEFRISMQLPAFPSSKSETIVVEDPVHAPQRVSRKKRVSRRLGQRFPSLLETIKGNYRRGKIL